MFQTNFLYLISGFIIEKLKPKDPGTGNNSEHSPLFISLLVSNPFKNQMKGFGLIIHSQSEAEEDFPRKYYR